MIVEVKEIKGRDRVVCSWAREESIRGAGVTAGYQGSGRAKPCLSWVYWTRRRFWVQSIS